VIKCCVSFGVYPSYTAGILNSVKEINFYVFREKLNYADYVENVLLVKSELSIFLQTTILR